MQNYRLEVLGRYPTNTEALEYGLQASAPVWMPMVESVVAFTPDIIERLRFLRDESSYFWKTYSIFRINNVTVILGKIDHVFNLKVKLKIWNKFLAVLTNSMILIKIYTSHDSIGSSWAILSGLFFFWFIGGRSYPLEFLTSTIRVFYNISSMLDCYRTRSTTNIVFKKSTTHPTFIFWSVGAQMMENTHFINKTA